MTNECGSGQEAEQISSYGDKQADSAGIILANDSVSDPPDHQFGLTILKDRVACTYYIMQHTD